MGLYWLDSLLRRSSRDLVVVFTELPRLSPHFDMANTPITIENILWLHIYSAAFAVRLLSCREFFLHFVLFFSDLYIGCPGLFQFRINYSNCAFCQTFNTTPYMEIGASQGLYLHITIQTYKNVDMQPCQSAVRATISGTTILHIRPPTPHGWGDQRTVLYVSSNTHVTTINGLHVILRMHDKANTWRKHVTILSHIYSK